MLGGEGRRGFSLVEGMTSRCALVMGEVLCSGKNIGGAVELRGMDSSLFLKLIHCGLQFYKITDKY